MVTLSLIGDWKKTEMEWKSILTPEQFRITRKKGTEGPGVGRRKTMINI